ncbi:hypothetical protein BH09PAT4_BH09PAT4_00480 [soil metagenome]
MVRTRVKRNLIRFLDSRWGFIHHLQVGVFAVAVAGAIIGISALATGTTGNLDESNIDINQSAASSTHTASNPASTTAAETELAQLPKDTKSTVAEIKAPQDTQPASSTAKKKEKAATLTETCDQRLLQTAKDMLARKTNLETIRHRDILRALQNIGLVTRFLNPNIYSYRLSAESDKHEKMLTSIQLQYKQDLASAHCSV